MSLCGTLRIIYILLLPIAIAIDTITTNGPSQATSTTLINSSTTSTQTSTTSGETENWSLASQYTTNQPEETHENLPESCSQSLDLEHGKGIFSASGWSPGSVPNDARFNGRGGWIGGFEEIHYLQVDLEEVYQVSGLRIQPHAQWPRNIVKEFQVVYSKDGFHWQRQPIIVERTITTKFNQSDFESLTIFDPILTARYIVINPINWVGNPGPALRVEFYGCKPPGSQSGSSIAPNVWRGDITSDATWGPGAPYLVHQPIRILPGITLTLTPGVEILFANILSGIYIEGTLIANGTEDAPISFQAYDVMSQLTVRPFWQGLTFIPGGIQRSSLRHVRVHSAVVGVYTTAGLTYLEHLKFERCQCGLRVEGGVQTLPHLIKSSEFYHNDNGLQIYNVSGNAVLNNLSLHANKFVSVSITYPMLLRDEGTENRVELSDAHITNSSYGISISSFQSINVELSHLTVSDVEYGVYIELSDAISLASTTLRESHFTRNFLYSVYVDFKRYARYRWYGDGGNFSVIVENCSFREGANGLSYFGPESLFGQKSMLTVRKCEFHKLLMATILQLQEGSAFFINGNTYTENGDRVLDVTYNALDVTGIVAENKITNNVPNNETRRPFAYVKKSLMGFYGVSNAQLHGQVTIEYNEISNNNFPRIIETDLMYTHVSFNVFGNPSALCELCVRLLWIPGGLSLNASHNWWGYTSLVESRRRVLDFFTDMDFVSADLTPILKEPRVRGASWDSASMHLKQGDDYSNGGIIAGNVTFSSSQIAEIKGSILVPASSSLTLTSGLNLKFVKDIGILVEGELKVEGVQDRPIVLDSSIPSTEMAWKGIRLSYSKHALFRHVAVIHSRGIQSIGYVPEMNALDVTYSTGVGLLLYVVQPVAIRLVNSYFMYNEIGVHIQVQGNGTTEFDLIIDQCHFEQNQASGLILEAGNIKVNANLTGNTVNDNGEFGMVLNVSDGNIIISDNIFNDTKEVKRSLTKSTYVSIDFDERCHSTRNISVIKNHFISTRTPLRGLRAKTSCIQSQSTWVATGNNFINGFDGSPGEAASIIFDTVGTPDLWPLSFSISGNTFECVRVQGLAMRLTASHGEDVIVYGNNIFGCANPAQIFARFNPHRLAFSTNQIINSGTIVLHATPPTTIKSNGSTSFSPSSLDFSHNNISRGNGSATLKTTGYDAEIHLNFYENPAADYELWVGDLAPVNATLNWWGSDDFNRIVSRVFDGRVDFTRAQATVFPCLLSKNYSDISTAFPDVFQITDGIIGGSVKGNVSLPEQGDPYEVQYPIRIPYGSSLTIPPGTILKFRNQTGIYALGHLSMDGKKDKWIQMGPSNGTTSWKGITIGKPRHEFMRVRLAGGSKEDAGRVEAFVAESWVGVCAEGFKKANAHVVCKELGFNDMVTISSVNAGNLKIGVANVQCNGLELSLLDCDATIGNVNCPNNLIATIVCNSQSSNRVRRSVTDDSDGLPTIVNYVRIDSADVGIQIDDIDGIQLHHVEITSSRGPGVILNPKNPHGVLVTETLVTKGQDIGMDVRGTGPIILRTTNITRNNQSGLEVSSLAPEETVEIAYANVWDNGIRGVNVISDGSVNLTKCEIQRNGDLGVSITARRMNTYKTLIEDHVKRGANFNSSRGDVNIANTAFVNNGGTDVAVVLNTAPNTTNVNGLSFLKSALVNSTYNTKESQFYAMHVTMNAHPQDGRIPIVFSDCSILDAFSDGIWIISGHGLINLQVVNCTFERVNGTAVHLETMEPSPAMNIEANQFKNVKKETVEVEVRS